MIRSTCKIHAIGQALVASLALVACKSAGPGPSAPPGVTLASITVTSTSFASGGLVPVDFTCDGKGTTPALTWSAVPDTTQALAVVIDDPDAPGSTYTHLAIANLAPDLRTLKEGFDPEALGGVVGRNDAGHTSYDGPCPPRGEEHRYRFMVYALDRKLAVKDGFERAELDARMNAHVVAEGTLSALFGH